MADDIRFPGAFMAFFACRDGVAATKMLVRGADLWRFVHGVARRYCALQWCVERRWRCCSRTVAACDVDAAVRGGWQWEALKWWSGNVGCAGAWWSGLVVAAGEQDGGDDDGAMYDWPD
ncbi:hypothetical protein DEO72_LG10g3007 [Vigna unguiculata]|uniref:Uncharacterized protein n=1 Tax=Vigna unguiculata TaxID=3917 RepID=A0A4D6ND17_VIGUN|nr:hypothetical protein DEO72_LG10g3007 [Vigna unguiculata]